MRSIEIDACGMCCWPTTGGRCPRSSSSVLALSWNHTHHPSFGTYIEVLHVYPVLAAFRGEVLTTGETGIQNGFEWMSEYAIDFSGRRHKVVKDGGFGENSYDWCDKEFGGRYVWS